MLTPRFHLLITVLWLGAAPHCLLAAAPRNPIKPDANQVEGQALAAKLCANKPAEDFETHGLLITRYGYRKRVEVPVHLWVRTGEKNWRSIYYAYAPLATAKSRSAPALSATNNALPIEQLVVVHSDGSPNEYLFSTNQPTRGSGNLVVLAGDKANIPFANTDFLLTDLGLDFFHWPSQRIVKREMRKGRSCRVLESVNPNSSAGGYTRVLSWIDHDTEGLVRAEAYDGKGKLLKEFEVISLKKINGHMQLKAIEMRNVQTDSTTRLEFDFTITNAAPPGGEPAKTGRLLPTPNRPPIQSPPIETAEVSAKPAETQ